jgi:hypothetical protein
MTVSAVIAAEADTFVTVLKQQAHARNLSLEGTRWQSPHDPENPQDQSKVELTITNHGRLYTFALPLTDLLLFAHGHRPRGETREQRADIILDHLLPIP